MVNVANYLIFNCRFLLSFSEKGNLGWQPENLDFLTLSRSIFRGSLGGDAVCIEYSEQVCLCDCNSRRTRMSSDEKRNEFIY